MAIRWRLSGELVCAATSDEQDGDTYIDDRLHYFLSVLCGVLIADIRHEENGLWHWAIGEGHPILRAVVETPKPLPR